LKSDPEHPILEGVKKAFAYLRVSGKGQVEGDGFTRQLAAIRAHARTHGLRIVEVFRDEGVSGTKELENRPALSAMMEALHSNGVRVILIEKLDRLARDLMIQESIIADLQKHGFELVSVTEPDLCSNDPTRKLMRQMMGAFAEYEKTMIVQKLRGARQRKRTKTGRCEGRKPFGFYPGEDRIVGRMKALRAEGLSYDRIAERLNEEGIKPRNGQRWWGKTVNNIMGATSPRR